MHLPMKQPNDSANEGASTGADIRITPQARAKIDGVKQSNDFPAATLRLKISGREGPRFRYEIALEDPLDRQPTDVTLDDEGLMVVMDPDSARDLAGATITLDERVPGGALQIDNPNEGWRDPVASAVQNVIDQQINPGIASHGGNVTLLDVREDTVYIQLGGGCQGCAAVPATLRQGIEVAIKEQVPQISAVVDTTDHAAGTNPYYRPQHSH
jgi:Fe/S biogenesis protein NfuA